MESLLYCHLLSQESSALLIIHSPDLSEEGGPGPVRASDRLRLHRLPEQTEAAPPGGLAPSSQPCMDGGNDCGLPFPHQLELYFHFTDEETEVQQLRSRDGVQGHSASARWSWD